MNKRDFVLFCSEILGSAIAPGPARLEHISVPVPARLAQDSSFHDGALHCVANTNLCSLDRARWLMLQIGPLDSFGGLRFARIINPPGFGDLIL